MGNAIDLFVMVIYFAAIIYIGWIVAKKVKSKGIEEFAVSSKSMSLFPLILSVAGTHIGSGLAIGLIGKIYTNGAQAFWIGLAWFLGCIFWTVCLAKRIRKMAERKHWGITMGDLFEDYLGRPGRFLFGSIATWERMAVTGGQLVACGVLLSTLGAPFGITLAKGTIIAGFIVVLYVSLGGLTAVIWSDVLQCIIMVLGIGMLLPLILTFQLPSFGSLFASTQPNFYNPLPTSAPILITAAAWFTGALGNQSLWQRVVAAKDVKTAYWGNLIGAFVGIAWGIIMIYIAFAMKAISPNITGSPDSYLMTTIQSSFPIIITGLIFAAVMANIMSTADSCLLGGVMNLSHDLYAKTFKRDATENQVLRFARISTPIIGFVPVIFALWIPKIIEVQNLGYGMYGPAVIAPLWGSIFWKKTTPQGGVAAMIVGLIMGILWRSYQWLGVPYAIGGTICSMIVLVVVSLMTQKQKESMPVSTDFVEK